jgi:hypothetical protein
LRWGYYPALFEWAQFNHNPYKRKRGGVQRRRCAMETDRCMYVGGVGKEREKRKREIERERESTRAISRCYVADTSQGMQVASSRCQKTHKLITHITSRNE